VGTGGRKGYAASDMADLARLLRRFIGRAKSPAYLALLAYFKAGRKVEAALAEIRRQVATATGLATLRGFGPRYLHSIGQLYKGGPPEGLFIMFVRSEYKRLPIPGRPFGFGRLIDAQAVGDAQALIRRKRPTLVIAVDGDPADGLRYFAGILRKALA
jgi:hypothetical protein